MERRKLVCRNQRPIPLSVLSAARQRELELGDVGGAGFPVLLLLGLATRLSALGLIIVTGVAWAAVHAGAGYNVCDNGYKMALIYIVVLIPILLQGAGCLSLDALLKKRFLPEMPRWKSMKKVGERTLNAPTQILNLFNLIL